MLFFTVYRHTCPIARLLNHKRIPALRILLENQPQTRAAHDVTADS